MRALVLVSLGLAACVSTKSDPPIAVRPAPPAASQSSQKKDESAADAAVARAPVPEGPPKWKSIPKDENGFYVVLDGLCSQLAASRVGKDVVVHYGGGGNGVYFNGQRRGVASFIALRDGGLESIGDPSITSPTGVAGASLDDFWIADSTGSRSSEGAVLHRYSAGKWKRYERDQTNLHAWVDGGIIGTLGFAATSGDVWVEGSSTKPPAALGDQLMHPALAAFPTGEVLVVSRRADERGVPGEGPLVARSWAPGKKVVEHTIDRLFPDDRWPSLHEVAPDEVYIVGETRVARWDGATVRAVGATKGGAKITRVRRAASDDVWVLTEPPSLQRITKEGTTTIATPEPVVAFDGVDRGATWIVGASGKLHRREGEAWKPMALASPAFSAQKSAKAKQVVVVSPDDVLVVAMYWEKAPGWKEQELHTMLLRTKPVKETLRCNEPDPENNNIELGRGFQSWPPMATAECATPFVVIARRSNANPKTDDWPRVKAALKGRTELVRDGALVELRSGDRTFVGARAKDLDAGRKIVELVAKNDRLRPEIVCGDPDATRTIALDR